MFVITRRISWGKIAILESNLKFRGQNLGYLSPTFLEAKFGAPTKISEANFRAKLPALLIWKYPLGHSSQLTEHETCHKHYEELENPIS